LSFATGSSSCSCRVDNQTNISQIVTRHLRTFLEIMYVKWNCFFILQHKGVPSNEGRTKLVV